MKTITKSKQPKPALFPLLVCAGVVAAFVTGCAEAPPVTVYDRGYYFPTGNIVRDYWGYYQPYPFQDTPNGPRYRIIDGQHVYEPYYYGSVTAPPPTAY